MFPKRENRFRKNGPRRRTRAYDQMQKKRNGGKDDEWEVGERKGMTEGGGKKKERGVNNIER